MEIVVNEWLLEYLRPNAQESDKVAAIRFLNALEQKCDKVVIKRNSPFAKKFYTFWNQFRDDFNTHKNFSKLNRILFRDSNGAIMVDDNEIQILPDDITTKTPIDDKYLIELWYLKQERIVLTTDTKLKEKLKDIPNLKIYLLQEFLQEYLA